MPAASCRIMPARSISRCETISASFGFSLRIGRKNRDSRIGTLKESVKHGRPAVKPDRAGKHKGRACESGSGGGFPAISPVTLSVRLRHERVTNQLLEEKLMAQF